MANEVECMSRRRTVREQKVAINTGKEKQYLTEGKKPVIGEKTRNKRNCIKSKIKCS